MAMELLLPIPAFPDWRVAEKASLISIVRLIDWLKLYTGLQLFMILASVTVLVTLKLYLF